MKRSDLEAKQKLTESTNPSYKFVFFLIIILLFSVFLFLFKYIFHCNLQLTI